MCLYDFPGVLIGSWIATFRGFSDEAIMAMSSPRSMKKGRELQMNIEERKRRYKR
jgi:hypothetical protein